MAALWENGLSGFCQALAPLISRLPHILFLCHDTENDTFGKLATGLRQSPCRGSAAAEHTTPRERGGAGRLQLSLGLTSTQGNKRPRAANSGPEAKGRVLAIFLAVPQGPRLQISLTRVCALKLLNSTMPHSAFRGKAKMG